jgi:hypothetical protein
MMMLEELHSAFVPFSRRPTSKSAEILAATGARIRLAGIEAILPVLEFSNHGDLLHVLTEGRGEIDLMILLLYQYLAQSFGDGVFSE